MEKYFGGESVRRIQSLYLTVYVRSMKAAHPDIARTVGYCRGECSVAHKAGSAHLEGFQGYHQNSAKHHKFYTSY